MGGSYSAIQINTLPSEELEAVGTLLVGAVGGVMIVASIIVLIMGIIMIIANWKIFTKAGKEGWECLIPIYSTVVLFKIVGISPWLILLYFTSIIPVIGSLAVIGLTIYVYYKLSKAFGHDIGFTIGLLLLNPIFMMILGFGSSEYQLNQTTERFYTEQ